jgi:hypothetical protein
MHPNGGVAFIGGFADKILKLDSFHTKGKGQQTRNTWRAFNRSIFHSQK